MVKHLNLNFLQNMQIHTNFDCFANSTPNRRRRSLVSSESVACDGTNAVSCICQLLAMARERTLSVSDWPSGARVKIVKGANWVSRLVDGSCEVVVVSFGGVVVGVSGVKTVVEDTNRPSVDENNDCGLRVVEKVAGVVDASRSASRPNGTCTGASFGDVFDNWSKNVPRPSDGGFSGDFVDGLGRLASTGTRSGCVSMASRWNWTASDGLDDFVVSAVVGIVDDRTFADGENDGGPRLFKGKSRVRSVVVGGLDGDWVDVDWVVVGVVVVVGLDVVVTVVLDSVVVVEAVVVVVDSVVVVSCRVVVVDSGVVVVVVWNIQGGATLLSSRLLSAFLGAL